MRKQADEFFTLLEFRRVLFRSTAHALSLVEQLRAQIARHPLAYRGEQIPLSATFGMAEWPSDGSEGVQLYRCADRRLYRGKHQRSEERRVGKAGIIAVAPGASS